MNTFITHLRESLQKRQISLLKLMITLILVIPALVSAADHSVNLTVKGVAFNSCNLSLASTTLDLGEFRANQWSNSNRYMTNDVRKSIKISDCDAGTTVTITASGIRGEEAFWMSNTDGSNPDIQAEVTIVKHGETTYWTLFMDGSRPRLYTTMEANSSQDLVLRAVLTRKSLDSKPSGTFKGNMTINFSFD